MGKKKNRDFPYCMWRRRKEKMARSDWTVRLTPRKYRRCVTVARCGAFHLPGFTWAFAVFSFVGLGPLLVPYLGRSRSV